MILGHRHPRKHAVAITPTTPTIEIGAKDAKDFKLQSGRKTNVVNSTIHNDRDVASVSLLSPVALTNAGIVSPNNIEYDKAAP